MNSKCFKNVFHIEFVQNRTVCIGYNELVQVEKWRIFYVGNKTFEVG